MKKHVLFVCVAALVCVSKIYAHTDRATPCASVSLIYASPSWGDVKDGRGLGASIGATLYTVFYAEVEAMYLRHDMKNLSGSLTQVPLLGTIAFRLPIGRCAGGAISPLGLQIGVSAGPAMQQWKIVERSSTNVVAAFAGQALIAWFPSPKHWQGSINAGVRELWMGKSDDRKAGGNALFSVGADFFF